MGDFKPYNSKAHLYQAAALPKQQLKENENSEQRPGCPICGKKRHLKTSDCPNNKNKK
jgi:hypothetical protein